MSAGTFVTNDATHCDKHKKVAKKRSLGLVIKKYQWKHKTVQ